MDDIIDRYKKEVILDGLKLQLPLPPVCTFIFLFCLSLNISKLHMLIRINTNTEEELIVTLLGAIFQVTKQVYCN